MDVPTFGTVYPIVDRGAWLRSFRVTEFVESWQEAPYQLNKIKEPVSLKHFEQLGIMRGDEWGVGIRTVGSYRRCEYCR